LLAIDGKDEGRDVDDVEREKFSEQVLAWGDVCHEHMDRLTADL